MPGERIARKIERTNANARGYDYQWQKERAEFLILNPVCVHCRALGVITAARVVDHVIPHRGDPVLFWSRSNWQALCVTCHNQWKQKMENATPQRVRIPAKPADVDTEGEGGGKVQPEADT